MQCPVCAHKETRVLDSREIEDGLSIRRRRQCMKCDFRFSTLENMEILNLRVKKSDGTTESYDKEKLTSGLKKALEKRPITAERFQLLTNRIERDIQMKAKSDVIGAAEIGAIVIKHLKRVDKVAYIRFASVYYAYEDLDEFRSALEDLIPHKKNNIKKK